MTTADLFSFTISPTPLSASFTILIALVVFAALLAFEVPGLVARPSLIKPTLCTYACCMLVVSLIAGWLVLTLSVSTCQPVSAATVDVVLGRLDA